MDNAVREKWLDEKPSPSNFKLKRFTNGIDPRTSTHRGSVPFMLHTTRANT
jgi:hypothetical protein